jgi:hypothetical protein
METQQTTKLRRWPWITALVVMAAFIMSGQNVQADYTKKHLNAAGAMIATDLLVVAFIVTCVVWGIYNHRSKVK